MINTIENIPLEITIKTNHDIEKQTTYKIKARSSMDYAEIWPFYTIEWAKDFIKKERSRQMTWLELRHDWLIEEIKQDILS